MNDRTIIIISHNVSLAPVMEKILFLENRELVEMGSHEQLIKIHDGH